MCEGRDPRLFKKRSAAAFIYSGAFSLHDSQLLVTRFCFQSKKSLIRETRVKEATEAWR